MKCVRSIQVEMRGNMTAGEMLRGGHASPDVCTLGASALSAMRDSRGLLGRGLRSHWRS